VVKAGAEPAMDNVEETVTKFNGGAVQNSMFAFFHQIVHYQSHISTTAPKEHAWDLLLRLRPLPAAQFFIPKIFIPPYFSSCTCSARYEMPDDIFPKDFFSHSKIHSGHSTFFIPQICNFFWFVPVISMGVYEKKKSDQVADARQRTLDSDNNQHHTKCNNGNKESDAAATMILKG
jgi:hypothetical protein